MKFFRKLNKDEKGATAIEYGLIAALIAVTIIVGAGLVGDNINSRFEQIADAVGNAGGGEGGGE
jgi:pilus assembly protein Flp/PilA